MPAEAAPTTWTVQQLLTWTTKHFTGKSIESPSVEARILLAHVLGCRPLDVLTRYEEEPTTPQRSRYRELIQKRTEGCPVAYLVGTRDFYLLSYDVNSAVLIPRPDTETLVEAALTLLKHHPTARVLDVGTGSGCIAVSLAHQAKQAHITAVDISPEAAAVARQNAGKHGVTDRVTVVVGDLFAPLPAGAKYQLIVSNPPYISPAEIATLEVQVKDYEPRLALDGGPDGLAFYRRFARDAAQYLVPHGTLMVEVGHTQDAAVRALLAEYGWQAIESRKDMAGHHRVVTARHGG